MPRTSSRRLAVSMLSVTFLALLFVASGVPDPARSSLSVASDPSPGAITSLAEPEITSISTTTTAPVCPDLPVRVKTMDRADLERCFIMETTALAQAAQACPVGFDLSTITDHALIEYCGGLRETDVALEYAAAMFRPTVLGPTETPVVATPAPPNYIPERFTVVEPVPGEDRIGLRFLRSATSVWQLGAISDVSGYGYDSIWIWTKPPGAGADRATIGFFILGNAETNEGPRYHMIWETPEDVGTITITGITEATTERDGPTGLVAFTTSAGGSGTFDLATQQWSFAP